MTLAGTLFLVVQISVPGAAVADTLLAAADTLSPAALEQLARSDPAAVREAVRTALGRSVQGRSDGALSTARRLAAAHASAWDDPFLVRQVDLFGRQPLAWRRSKLEADSLRRAGAAALAEAGVTAALELWRESLGIATALADTATMAAAMQNIGVGYLRESVLDSAETYLIRSRRLAAEAGDRLIEGNALGALHFVSIDRGDVLLAREQLGEAMALRQRIGDTRGAAADLNSRGLLAWEVGDLAGARRDFEGALDLNRREDRAEVAATNLVNLGGLASMEGEFARALALYGEALTTYRSRGMEPDAADVLWGLGQLELRRGDYPRARSALAEALAIYEVTGPAVAAIEVRRELAGALAAMGEIQVALDELRRAEREADSDEVPVDVRAGVALARADLAITLNMLAEAERAYGVAEALYGEAGDPAGQAEARQGQGFLLLEREEHAQAERVLAGAVRAQEASENARGAAITRTFLAEARRGQGDFEGARSLLRQAAAELARLGDPVAEAFAWAELAGVEARQGLPLTADSLYATALARLGDRPAPDVRWRMHLGRGLAARALGSLDAAARELRSAVEQVERAAESLALAERSAAYRTDKSEAYAQLALTERMRGRLTAAFEASERLRARETLEILSQGRASTPPGVAGDLSAREHDLRVRIAELAREVEPVDAAALALRGPGPAQPGPAALESLSRARADYAELLLEIRERAPRQAEFVSPGTTNWRDVARRLTPGTALVEYLVTDSGSVAFVVTPDTLASVDLGIGRRDLARLIEFARALIEGSVRAEDTQWRGPLRRLHEYLIAPAEGAGLLSGVDRLVLVPHAELHYLPFAALLDADGRFLVERFAIGVAPSASVWLALGDRPAPTPARDILALAPRPEALPGTSREVDAVARLALGGASVLRGSQASEEAFRRLAGEYRVLHLATYGVLNTHNPLFSFVDLAPGAEDDGRLEVHEVLGLDLTADLVVLSACQTALGSGALADVPEGDDWVGLTRAFLHAGAARVLATLWAVEDRATADLMERFYERRGAGANDMTALADAQRQLLGNPATAHPFYWAGMVLVGQQGGADAR
jgi:CHAT domain-containing protein